MLNKKIADNYYFIKTKMFTPFHSDLNFHLTLKIISVDFMLKCLLYIIFVYCCLFFQTQIKISELRKDAYTEIYGFRQWVELYQIFFLFLVFFTIQSPQCLHILQSSDTLVFQIIKNSLEQINKVKWIFVVCVVAVIKEFLSRPCI